MSIVQSTSDNDKEWYGTNQYQRVEEVSLVPIQLVGLVQCDLESDDCRGVPCDTIPAFTGDYNSFLFKFATDDNTGDLTDDYRIEKYTSSWNEVVTGNLNNTLGSESGVKYTFGSFASYPLYSGFKVDWQKIFDLFGAGIYRFKVYNKFDTNAPLYSPRFDLKDFSCDNAAGTVKIKVQNVGNYRNFNYTKSGQTLQYFDLVNLTWEDETRHYGRLLDEAIDSEEIVVKYGDYENRQHNTDDYVNFTLKVFKTTEERKKRLYLYGLRGANITVTDNNLDSAYNYTDFDVISKSEINSGDKYVNDRFVYNIDIGLKGGFDLGYRKC